MSSPTSVASSLQSISLKLLRDGERGKVAQIYALRDATASSLRAIGLMPGQTITLVQRFPKFVVRLGNRCHSLDQAAINAIYVWVLSP